MLTAAKIDVDGVVVEKSRRSVLDRIVLYGVFGLLLLSPLAFGAVEPWSIFALEASAALFLVLWVVRQITLGELHLSRNPLFPPMLAFAVLIAFQIRSGLTAYRYQTSSQGLLYCAYGVLCFLVVQSLRRSFQVSILAIMFSAYGSALAVFALLQGMSSNGKVYWLLTPKFGGWIYGPYVNHNHYAGLMEMLLPIPLVFSLTRRARGSRRTMSALAAAVMAVTIFLSGSRGGMIAFAVQMAVLAALFIRQRKGRKPAFALGVFLLIVIALLTWLGGGELSKRMGSIHSEAHGEMSGGTRVAIVRDGLKMFARKPILGWGLGAFPFVYPEFRTFYTNFFINQAHNDYLQLLVEMGTLGFAIMIWFLAALYHAAGRKIHNWMDDTNGAVGLAAMLGVTGILVHSFVDFNLQIPANASLFYVLCVVAAMKTRFGLSRRKPIRQHEIPEGAVA